MIRSDRGFSIRNFWVEWSIYIMMLLFFVVIFTMINQQYATFDTRSSDLDRFIQGMWNTLNGRFLYSTIEERSILGGHFTPYFILISPALYIWPDPRVFSIIQTAGLAIAGFFFYLIVKEKHPVLAPFIALAFFLNPSLHQIGLLELRRITLAVPYLAFALYGLSIKNKKFVAIGLIMALLCKENVALPMALVGLYYVLFERDWKFGGFLMVFAIGWVIMVLTIINPIVDPQYVLAENSLDAYRGLNYFAQYGSTPQEILIYLISRPGDIFAYILDSEAQIGLMRLFIPLGIVLPFLSPRIALLTIPNLLYMLLGSYELMHRLDVWYVTIPLVILFGAICVRVREFDSKLATTVVTLLFIFTVWGYSQFSYLPFGGRYNSVRNIVTEHHETASKAMGMVPSNAKLATQSAFTPHLAMREELFLYPWLPRSGEPMDYYLLDRNLKSYPLNEIERNESIDNLIADPSLVIEAEVDGIYLFNLDGEPNPSKTVNQIWNEAILLDRFELAVSDEDGMFKTESSLSQLNAGDTVRVTLYWEATGNPDVDRTVSVRLQSGEQLVSQHDMVPSNGARPTSWWEAGWSFRDVYYLEVPLTLIEGQYDLRLLLYDSFSLEPVPTDNGEVFIYLTE